MFRQRELFKILVSKSGLIHRGICNRSKLRREFDTGEIVVVRKKVNSIRNDNITQKLVLKKKGPYRFLEKATLISYWLQRFTFLDPHKK